MKSGKSGAASLKLLITNVITRPLKTKFACEVKNFKVEDYFDRKDARRYDRYAMSA